jgi:5-methylcytosine-specific restriction endonuclease McrA
MRILKRTTLVCPGCHKPFVRQNSNIRQAKTHYCSKRCAADIRWPKINHVCRHCGQSFQRGRKSRDNVRYCSVECTRASAPPRGENHFRWEGGISKRSSAVKSVARRKVREVGKCERCGALENLHAHHVEHYAVAPERRADPSNLEVLCMTCHGNEHPNYRNVLLRPYVRSGKNITCIICGVARYVSPHAANTAKFCSLACRDTARRQGITRAPVPRAGKEISCAFCGQLRYVRPSLVGEAKFCSQKCWRASTSDFMKRDSVGGAV